MIGSAAYVGHWLGDATSFVKQHRALLAERPVWLFSSGPIGTELVDAKGRDVRTEAMPKEFAEFRERCIRGTNGSSSAPTTRARRRSG